MGAVLGGVGLGLVWGWLVAMVARPAPTTPLASALMVGLASLVLVAGIYGLVGLPAVLGLLGASGVAVLVGIAFRTELERTRETQ